WLRPDGLPVSGPGAGPWQPAGGRRYRRAPAVLPAFCRIRGAARAECADHRLPRLRRIATRLAEGLRDVLPGLVAAGSGSGGGAAGPGAAAAVLGGSLLRWPRHRPVAQP